MAGTDSGDRGSYSGRSCSDRGNVAPIVLEMAVVYLGDSCSGSFRRCHLCEENMFDEWSTVARLWEPQCKRLIPTQGRVFEHLNQVDTRHRFPRFER